jgi:hypothetical protein
MSKTQFNKDRVYNALKNKLNINFKPGRELKGWYYLDGIKTLQFRVQRGRGSLSKGFQKQIEQTSRLSNNDFERLILCPMTGPKFDNLMRELRDKRQL